MREREGVAYLPYFPLEGCMSLLRQQQQHNPWNSKAPPFLDFLDFSMTKD